MPKKIIVADTNLWISLIIAKLDNKFSLVLQQKEYEFYSCDRLQQEIEQSLTKKKLQKYLTTELLNDFWILFSSLVENIVLVSVVNICRDPKDNFLLALAKDAGADFLITGDNDLLVLEQFENTTILTLNAFVETYTRTTE